MEQRGSAKSPPWRRCASTSLVAVLLGALLLGLSSPDASAEPVAASGAGVAPAADKADAPPTAEQQAARTKDQAPPSDRTDAHAAYRALILTEASREGLAPEIAEAVMAVESGYNPAAIGGAGEIGLMQILPSTARMLGFVGSDADLAVPSANIHYGVTYLAQAWRLAGGDLCTAVMKYRAGHGETRFSYLSVNYCLAVRGKLLAHGFKVTGSVPVATFGEPGGAGAGGSGCRRRCIRFAGVGHVNLAALNTQLSTLVMQVRPTR